MTIRVCVFSGASALPVTLAAELGLFAAVGLDVLVEETRNSDELMGGLLSGTFSVVHAAADNVVAWRDRTGAPIVAWIGGATGPLALVARPDIRSVGDLAGKSIAVDAVRSGFVSVLLKILRGANVPVDGVRLDPVGATHLRAAALRAGETDATMLTLPWSALAARDGFSIIADGRAAAPRLQGVTGASLEGWLDSEQATADAYLRGLVAALTWLHIPANEPAARDFIASRHDVDSEVAGEILAAFTDPRWGWPASALLDPAGIAEVCALRTENGEEPLEPADAYLSLDPYRRVMGFGLIA